MAGHLVLTRKVGQQILIGDDIAIEVVRIRGGLVRIGVTAPAGLKVLRSELQTQGLRNEAEKTSVATNQHGPAIEGPTNRQAKAAGLIAQVQAAARRRREAGQAAGIAEACPAGTKTSSVGSSERSREQAA